VVAWILCNKGSRVSPTFARLISQLGGPKKEEEGEQTKPHAVFALLAQVHCKIAHDAPSLTSALLCTLTAANHCALLTSASPTAMVVSSCLRGKRSWRRCDGSPSPW
jgi:hypothetical protein